MSLCEAWPDVEPLKLTYLTATAMASLLVAAKKLTLWPIAHSPNLLILESLVSIINLVSRSNFAFTSEKNEPANDE